MKEGAIITGKLLLITAVFLLWVGIAPVGAFKLLDKAKEQVQESVSGPQKPSQPAASPQTQAPASFQTLSRKNIQYTPHSSGNPPGIMYSTLLNGVKIDYKTGEFYLSKIQFVFLPTPQVSSYRPYDPNEGGELFALVKNSDGKQLARFDMYAKILKEPFWLEEGINYVDSSGQKISGKRGPVLEPGNYLLDFYAGGEHFYHFDFSVDKRAPESAFQGNPMWFLDGPWEDWGYLYYSNARPDQNLVWKIWLRDKSSNVRGTDAKVDVKIFRDGSPIASSRDATHTLKPWWNRFDYDLIEPMKGTSGGAYFKTKDLLARDGSYQLKMLINGSPYGTWNFSVKNGQLGYTGDAVRGQGDPKTFVEGGLDAWWYKK